MRKITTLIAILIALGLLLYTQLLENPNGESSEVPIYSLQKDKINQIEISEIGKETLILKKEEDGWQMLGEEQLPASWEKITELLENFAVPKANLIEGISAEKRSQFGLVPPEKTLLLKTDSGEEKLIIGKKTAVGWNRYVEASASNKIYLMSEYKAGLVTTDPEKFKAPPVPEPELDPQVPSEGDPDKASDEKGAH